MNEYRIFRDGYIIIHKVKKFGEYNIGTKRVVFKKREVFSVVCFHNCSLIFWAVLQKDGSWKKWMVGEKGKYNYGDKKWNY